LCGLLGLGKPSVAVAIMLDLSGSTYADKPFNAPDTIMAQEVAAVNAYLDANQRLDNPNKVQIFGFGGPSVIPLTKTLESDGEKVKSALLQSLQNPRLPDSLKPEPEQDNLNAPILQGIQALSTISACREVLTVSDSGIVVTRDVVVPEAQKHNVRVNAIVFAGEAQDLQNIVEQTRGLYLIGEASSLPKLFTQQFLPRFDSNLRWLVLCLGGAWIALMWLLVLPLDKWILQGTLKLPMHTAGQLALGNALFWTALTPLIIWQLWRVLKLPWFTAC
jgi:Ca-activated chloride channel homolog